MKCPECDTDLYPSDAFCFRCGVRLLSGVERKHIPRPYRRLIRDEHRKRLVLARSTILTVAMVFIFYGRLLWIRLEANLKRAEMGLPVKLGREALAQLRFNIASCVLMVLIYFVLFVWSKKNPLLATISALILFVTTQIWAFAVDPSDFLQTIFGQLFLTAVLLTGVRSALSERRISQEEALRPQ